MRKFLCLWRSKRGSNAAEYALILAAVGGLIALALLGLSGVISGSMNTSTNTIENSAPST